MSILKNKSFFKIILMVIVLIILGVVFVNQKKPMPVDNQQQLIGGQKDEYGCLIPAGYSWCEAKQKCLRTWEEECL